MLPVNVEWKPGGNVRLGHYLEGGCLRQLRNAEEERQARFSEQAGDADWAEDTDSEDDIDVPLNQLAKRHKQTRNNSTRNELFSDIYSLHIYLFNCIGFVAARAAAPRSSRPARTGLNAPSGRPSVVERGRAGPSRAERGSRGPRAVRECSSGPETARVNFEWPNFKSGQILQSRG